MGSLDNNIRLIRNETIEGGNTKERIAETFELLATELERKVNKDANKGLSSNDFSNEHKNKLEGLQQVDISGLLKKGAYTGNASSLKADIDKKVDKVAGKGLSSNDYTNEEKRKNEENALKRVANITVTGDVNKIITITFADSTVMQAPFKDNDHIPLADVHMNSLNFNVNTGVLTGVKSDGNEITVSLEGRYSLIGHHHDERYAPITHHHNEYALRTHRHNWDDIDGKPNNLATTESVKSATEGIQIGGRNLLRNSNKKITNSNYNIAIYQLTEEPKEGELFTITIKGQLGAGKDVFAIYNSGDAVELTQLYNKGNSIHQNTFKWKKSLKGGTDDNKTVWVWTYDSSVTVESTIEWIKLERGNVNRVDWSPAPEDLDFYKNTINETDLYSTFKRRDTGSYSVDNGGGFGTLLNFNSENSTSSIEFYKRNWYPATRLGVRNSVDNNRFNDDGGYFRDLAWYEDIHRVGIAVSTNYTVPPEHQNNTIFVENSLNIELNRLQNMGSISFIKTFDTGAVTFTCAGKNIIYPFDNTFNGKKGSTAVVSIYNNDCYIRISNV